MHERVETVVRVGGRRVHRFQVVREHRDDGSTREWIVVGIGDDAVDLADPDFEWTTSVPRDEFCLDRFEPLEAGDVPIWGY